MSDFLENLFPTEEAIPATAQLPAFIEQREYLINGELRIWNGPLNPVVSPVFIRKGDKLEQKTIGSTPLLTSQEAMHALESALAAYDLGHGAWPLMTVTDRIDHVERFLVKMRQQRSSVVNLLMWEIGKSQKDSEKEFDRTCDYIVDTINALKELDRNSAKFVQEQGIMGQVRRVPLGVALCMGPFNYPLNETFTTLFPALIMGNTVVFKPAKYGVLLVKPLLEAFRDCFPPGVINIIYGRGRETVGALMETGKIDVFAFIGTNKGANDLKRLHPKPHRLKAILGLDAKNPAIILPDADLDNAVSECVTGTLSFNGQRCTALKILFVHRSIIDQFIKKLCEAVSKLKPGMPWENGVSLTPVPEPGKVEYLTGLVNDAVQSGARIMNSGGGLTNQTFFYPAILYPVNDKMRVYSEEQFGPVIPIVPFENDQEPIRYVVNSTFWPTAQPVWQRHKTNQPVHRCFCQSGWTDQYQYPVPAWTGFLPVQRSQGFGRRAAFHCRCARVFSIRTLVAAKSTGENKQIIGNILKNRESAFLSTDYIF